MAAARKTKAQKRRSEIIAELTRLSHNGWKGDYASLEAELRELERAR